MMKSKIIIGISGKIGSGKTTLADFLSKEYKSNHLKVKFLNFADPLKEICYILTGYKGLTQEEKNIYLPIWNMTVGVFLQKMGTEVMRDNFDPEVWIKATQIAIDNDIEHNVFIIGDCRFPNEADYISKIGGYLIRLEGDPSNTRANSNRDLNHPSETGLDNYTNWYSKYANHIGLSSLEIFATEIVKQTIANIK